VQRGKAENTKVRPYVKQRDSAPTVRNETVEFLD
jgi:hypothetical protein